MESFLSDFCLSPIRFLGSTPKMKKLPMLHLLNFDIYWLLLLKHFGKLKNLDNVELYISPHFLPCRDKYNENNFVSAYSWWQIPEFV